MVDSVDTDPPLTEEDQDHVGDGPFERDTTLNICQRIHKVMQEVGGKVEKDGVAKIKMKTGGEFTYDYISHDAVTAHIRAACIKHGIFVSPSVVKLENNGNRTELTVDVHFINIDKPDEFINCKSVGYGVDSSDKGPGKAWSYAVKYAYLKLFMLNSADDIELTDTAHDPKTQNQSAVEAAEVEKRTAREAWVYTLKSAVDSAKTVDEIKKLRRINKKALDDAPVATEGYFNTMLEKRETELAAEQPPGDA